MKVRSAFVCLVSAALVALPSFGATTYYVSKTGSGGDGKSWETAKTTIQAAVDLCAAGDTVIVDDGEYADTTDVTISSTPVPTVVKISKQITLKSRNGKEKTHIVGAHANTANGLGAGAHRGIYNTASGTLIQGFTIRDCATVGTENAVNNRFSNGGAISCGSSAVSCSVVDCTIDNCCAGQGGACDNRVDFFRCLITRCRAVGVIQVFYRGSYAANCIIANCGNGSGEIMPNVQPMTVANCTFIANNCAISVPNVGQTNYLYNCAVLGNLQSVSSSAYTIPEYCVDSRTDGRIKTVGAAGHCQGGVDEWQYLSPASGDWRLMQGGVLKDAGSDAYADLSWIPEAYRTDFRGKPRKVGTVDIGAIELQADESAAVACTERLFLADANLKLTVDGQDLVFSPGQFWYAFDRWPGQLRVTPTFEGDVFGYPLTLNSPNADYVRFPDCNDDRGFWYTPRTGGSTTLKVTPSKGSTWADANYAGGDSDGTEAKPFTTIQEAFDAAPTNGVVYVKPGVYATGVNTSTGKDPGSSSSTGRLSIWKDMAVRSTAGAEQTVIKGGDDVYAIVLPSRRTRVAQVQGFTLTGQTGNGAGALYMQANNYATHLTDSIISNNVSSQSALYGGWAERCLFRDNFTTEENMNKGTSGARGTIAYGAALSGCVLEYSPEYFASGNRPVLCTSACQEAILLACTLNIPTADKINKTIRSFNTANGTTVAFNNALNNGGGLDTLGAGPQVGGNVASPGEDRGGWLTGYAAGLYFADAENRDYRPLGAAPGLDKGARAPDADLVFEVGDFNGRALMYRAGGAPIPGAFQNPLTSVSALTDGRSTVEPSGILLADVGETFTFRATAADCHKFLGWVVNGVTNLTEETTYVYTVTDAGSSVSLMPLCSTDIYVDAVNGNDANDALTPATARKSLASVSLAAVAGDVIHAAEGDYKDESVDWNPYYTEAIYIRSTQIPLPACRAVVKAGVSLIATGAKERTFITGAYDPAGEIWNGAHYTLAGTNAVRCLMAFAGARVEGFTIRDGATRGKSGGPDDINGGGCALAPRWTLVDSSTATFVNCDFSGGVARSGGDVCGGLYFKCRFSTGSSFSGAGGCAAWGARLVQCLVNRGSKGDTGVVSHRGLFNCTIYNVGTGGSADLTSDGGAYPIVNCALATGCTSGDAYVLKHMTNCVIRKAGDHAGKMTIDSATCANVTVLGNWLDAGVNADTGAVSKGAPVIDAGDTAIFRALGSFDGETDLAGVPRVMNDDKIDIGCCEYDWRGDYAAALGCGRRAAVAEVSSAVKLEGTALTIPAGCEVSFAWTPRVANETATLAVSTVESGARLLVYRGDELVNTISAAGEYEIAADAAPTEVKLVADGGSVTVTGFKPMRLGLSILVR